jgi:hypothetical protein
MNKVRRGSPKAQVRLVAKPGPEGQSRAEATVQYSTMMLTRLRWAAIGFGRRRQLVTLPCACLKGDLLVECV